jgi:hypothetical protein
MMQAYVGGYAASVEVQFDAVDFESITFDDLVAVGLTSTKVRPSGAHSRRSAYITFETGGVNIRYRYDGTAPTASEGHLLVDGAAMLLQGERNISRLKFILIATGSAKAKVTYHA